jgi:hypothetical protein
VTGATLPSRPPRTEALARTLAPFRGIAPGLELLPLVPAIVWILPAVGRESAGPFWWLAGVTGLGWALIGRWRTGIVVALARVFILIVALQALAVTTLAESCDAAIDAACDPNAATLDALFYPTLGALGLFYAGTTLLSALFVAKAQAAGRRLVSCRVSSASCGDSAIGERRDGPRGD